MHDLAEKKADKYLSKLERKRYDAMANSFNVKEAAQKLGISDGTLNNWNYKQRKRLVKERGHVNACLAQMRRSQLLKKILSVKRSMRKPDYILDEDEEDYD